MGRFLGGKSQSCARPQACHKKATLNPKLHPPSSPLPCAPKHSALVEVWMLSHRSDTQLPGSGHPHVLPESHGASSPLLSPTAEQRSLRQASRHRQGCFSPSSPRPSKVTKTHTHQP